MLIKLLLIFILSINLFAEDFRNSDWGMEFNEVVKKEKVVEIAYKEITKSKIYNNYGGEFVYKYIVDEYSFLDDLGSLGRFQVTYSFLKKRLYKGTYTKSIAIGDTSFERMKQFLIWKYGNNYKTYGLNDSFVWETGRSKILLNLFKDKSFSVEYSATIQEMKDFVDNIENGKDFIKDLGTEYREFNSLKEKI